MLVNIDKRAVFAHIPKTGGGSISDVLLRNGFVEYINAHANRLVDFPNFFKSCMVRNPYEIVASYYMHKKAAGYTDDFNSFIDDIIKMRSGSKITSQYDFSLDCNFVMRYENYDDDFRLFCNVINIEYIKPVKSIHKFYDYNWKALYNDEIAAKVYEKCHTDFKVFNYHGKSYID